MIFYLSIPDRLSDLVLDTLGQAEDSDGIVVSAVALGDLWYASHKSGPKSLAPGAFESLRSTVLDTSTNFDVTPITAATMEHFYRISLTDLPDPFDRFIVAPPNNCSCPLSRPTGRWGVPRSLP